jgi:hypothetical protein
MGFGNRDSSPDREYKHYFHIENVVKVFVESVKRQFISDKEKGQDAAGNSCAQTEDVNQCIELVPSQIA